LSWAPIYYGDIIAICLDDAVVEFYVKIGKQNCLKFVLFKSFLLLLHPVIKPITISFNPIPGAGFLLGCLSSLVDSNDGDSFSRDSSLDVDYPQGFLSVFSPPLSASVSSFSVSSVGTNVDFSVLSVRKGSFLLSPLKIDEEVILGNTNGADWNRMVCSELLIYISLSPSLLLLLSCYCLNECFFFF
jgi:hypothetical protein